MIELEVGKVYKVRRRFRTNAATFKIVSRRESSLASLGTVYEAQRIDGRGLHSKLDHLFSTDIESAEQVVRSGHGVK